MSEAVTPLTQAELDELVALEQKATPGRWMRVSQSPPQGARGVWVDTDADVPDGEYTLAEMTLTPRVEDDADFIARLRNAAPALLAEVVASRKFSADATDGNRMVMEAMSEWDSQVAVWLESVAEDALALCHLIEAMPASNQQTDVSVAASNLRGRLATTSEEFKKRLAEEKAEDALAKLDAKKDER